MRVLELGTAPSCLEENSPRPQCCTPGPSAPRGALCLSRLTWPRRRVSGGFAALKIGLWEASAQNPAFLEPAAAVTGEAALAAGWVLTQGTRVSRSSPPRTPLRRVVVELVDTGVLWGWGQPQPKHRGCGMCHLLAGATASRKEKHIPGKASRRQALSGSCRAAGIPQLSCLQPLLPVIPLVLHWQGALVLPEQVLPEPPPRFTPVADNDKGCSGTCPRLSLAVLV